MTRERIQSLDSLKGIACCIIAFFWHYQNLQSKSLGIPFYTIFQPLFDYGQYAVELFFILSGFGIAYAYKPKIKENLSFIQYMKRRYKKLYPLHFVTLLAVTVFGSFFYFMMGTTFFYADVFDLYHFVLNVLCVQVGWFTTDQSFNRPAWCISVEIFLYAIFFLTTKFSFYLTERYTKFRKNNGYLLINLMFFLIFLFVIYRYPSINYPILNIFMIRGGPAFI